VEFLAVINAGKASDSQQKERDLTPNATWGSQAPEPTTVGLTANIRLMPMTLIRLDF